VKSFSHLEKEKPNIVFILAGDMSFDSVSKNNEQAPFPHPPVQPPTLSTAITRKAFS
jgi:hypothetical protein